MISKTELYKKLAQEIGTSRLPRSDDFLYEKYLFITNEKNNQNLNILK